MSGAAPLSSLSYSLSAARHVSIIVGRAAVAAPAAEAAEGAAAAAAAAPSSTPRAIVGGGGASSAVSRPPFDCPRQHPRMLTWPSTTALRQLLRRRPVRSLQRRLLRNNHQRRSAPGASAVQVRSTMGLI